MTDHHQHDSVLDYLYVLVKWRRLIFSSVLIVGVVVVGISLMLPQAWTADTKLLPPEEEGADQMGLSMLLGSAVPAGLMGLVGASTPSERLVTFLESRRVLGAVVDAFDLVEIYGARHHSEAIDILDEHIDKELERDGTLVVSVTASSAQLGADLANALAAQLDTVNRQYKRQQARALREFLAERLRVTEGELKESASALRVFQEKHGLVDVEAQTAAAVELMRNIAQQLIEMRVQLQLMTRQLSEDSEERKLVEVEVEELSRQLQILLGNGAGNVVEGDGEGLASLGPPLRALPELLVEHTELALALELRGDIIRFLGTKFEEARYREALNTPTIQVLDRAVPPQFRSAPRRTLIILSAAIASLVLSTVVAFVLESWSRAGAEHEMKIQSIRELLRSPK